MAIRIAGPASLLLVVLLAAPWTAASGPIRLTAPYHHVVFTSNSTTNHTLSRCERYAADVAPHWNPASGAGGFDYRVSARSCPRSLYSSAEGNGSLQLLIPVHGALGSSNRSNVTLNWTVRAYLGIRAVVPGTCPSVVLNSTGDGGQGCEIDAAALLLTRVGLWDSTNGKFWDFSPKGSASTTEMLRLTVVNSTRCISYVCSSGNSTTGQPAVLRMNSTFSVWSVHFLDPAHRYFVTIQLASYAAVDLFGVPAAYSGASGSAWADLSPSHGEGFQLNSITVS